MEIIKNRKVLQDFIERQKEMGKRNKEQLDKRKEREEDTCK